MSTVPQLHRRLSLSIERGRGIRFEAADLDLLAQSGAYERLCASAAAAQVAQASLRAEKRAWHAAAALKAAPDGARDLGADYGSYDPGPATLALERVLLARDRPIHGTARPIPTFGQDAHDRPSSSAVLVEMQRRLSVAMERERGIALGAAQLDAFVSCGAFAVISAAAADAQKNESSQRLDP